MSRLSANTERVSKEVVEKVKAIEEKLIAEASAELETMRDKTKEKKLTEIHVKATVQAFHELVAEGHKVVADFGTLAQKEKAARKNPKRTMIHPVTKEKIEIAASTTPAKTVIGLEKPAEL